MYRDLSQHALRAEGKRRCERTGQRFGRPSDRAEKSDVRCHVIQSLQMLEDTSYV